ncbi:MAG: pirin family protein [Corynebacterium sp.]|uniref:pirin family protein n=1 Tax=Corynebacterium sp. TaxID=1720 RepID=UPI0026DFB4AA|nr:pirin family protein [Corynebacterium sp.]MDO5669941.1 pirin family protein [Corynebacterium sp.]
MYMTTSNVPFRLTHPWQGTDPFLFAVFHQDAFPAGDADMGPGSARPEGWSMYHGRKIPGFPAHPHRGFETITLVTSGHVDHTDSVGAAARYGQGDAQWLTTGGGVTHSEMFPLINEDSPNPLELFQIWLNLPPESKTVPAEFTMQWGEDIPVHQAEGGSVRIIAGALGDATPLNPPVNSWAADPAHDVAVWLIEVEAGQSLTLPASKNDETRRTLYVFSGDAEVEGSTVAAGWGYQQVGQESTEITAGQETVRALVLQGVPIGAPVHQHGPFVANSHAELQQAFIDYQETRFGGWPWPTTEEVFPRDAGRFARFPDGSEQRP